MAEKLFRVYLHTEGDESVREVIVTALNKDQAHDRALAHVKASNPSKGDRRPIEAKKLTKILVVKPTSQPHCLVIHQIPIAVFKNLRKV